MSGAAPAGGADPAAVGRAVDALEAAGMTVRSNEPIGPLTTYRVGGAAAVAVTVTSVEDLIRVAEVASELPILVIGRGSNLLVADGGFGGIAVLLDADAFGAFAVSGRTVLVGAALALPALARRSVAAGLTGMEWAVGVPGSVGGGVRMNAGGHGSDMAATFRRCRVVDVACYPAGVDELGPVDVAHGFRSSSLRSSQVVVDAEFALADGDRDLGAQTIRDIVRWRREHQPGGQNAGSVFVNPMTGDDGVTEARRPGIGGARSAGWLIEAAGLKGRRIGTATVSDKHANFIQADPEGSADDVVALMRVVQAAVEERMGVRLRTENRLIGVPDAESLQEG